MGTSLGDFLLLLDDFSSLKLGVTLIVFDFRLILLILLFNTSITLAILTLKADKGSISSCI